MFEFISQRGLSNSSWRVLVFHESSLFVSLNFKGNGELGLTATSHSVEELQGTTISGSDECITKPFQNSLIRGPRHHPGLALSESQYHCHPATMRPPISYKH